MGKGKIPIKKIEKLSSRQVTFAKRKKGLFKKARDLSVLCDVNVAVVILSATGRPYDFASTSMKLLLDQYNRAREETQLLSSTAEAKLWKVEVEGLKKELEDLQIAHRQLMGEDITQLNIQQLETLETQLQMSGKSLHARKEQILKERVQELNQQEILVHQENLDLHRRVASMQQEIARSKKLQANKGNTGRREQRGPSNGEHEICAPDYLQLSLP